MENENKRADEPEGQAPLNSDAAVLQKIIAELAPLSWDSRLRMIDTVCTFFNLKRSRTTSEPDPAGATRPAINPTNFLFSEKETPSVKQFMIDKAPTTDVERVACLGYYLTHHRGMPHFKTKDITDLNIEAAQRPFSNAAYAVTNAANSGLLVPSVKGCKQLSGPGEQFVQALPDREAAREAFERVKWRRTGKRSATKSDPDS
jgi:hypothetical protein